MGSFCTLGICIFSEFAISHKIGLIEQNENSIVTQTSERTRECSGLLSMCRQKRLRGRILGYEKAYDNGRIIP